MKYRGILLDIDNTLYAYSPADKAALSAAVKYVVEKFCISEAVVKEAYYTCRRQIHRELPAIGASHDRLLYFQRLLETLDISALKHALDVYEAYWWTFFDNMALRPGVWDFVEHVKKLPICAVSDVSASIQHRKLRYLGLDERVNFIACSDEAGADKPDARIFTLACRKLSLDFDDVCMIGDNWEKDAWGASQLGMQAFWFNPAVGQRSSNPYIKSFEEFKELPGLLK